MITSLRKYLEDTFKISIKGIVFAYSKNQNGYFVFDYDQKIIEYINSVLTKDKFEKYDYLTQKQFNKVSEKLEQFRVNYAVYATDSNPISNILLKKYGVFNQYAKIKAVSLSSNNRLSNKSLLNYINDHSNTLKPKFCSGFLCSKREYVKYLYGSFKKKTNSIEEVLELERKANSKKSFRSLLARSRPSDKASWSNKGSKKKYRY